MDSRIQITALLYVFTVAFGIWLSRAGKPYNVLLINIHKLVALGAVIYTAVTLYQLRTGVDTTALALGAIVLTALLVVGLFVSGALLSIGKPDHVAILVVHKVAPLLLTITGAGAIYLLAAQITAM